MAARDIMPFVSQQGGHTRMLAFQMGAGTTATGEDSAWREGNILLVDAAVGDINPHIDGTLDPSTGLVYIAAGSSEGLISNAVGPRNVTNPTAAQISDIMVPVWAFDVGVEFVTSNVYTASDTELDLDSGFLIGSTADLWVDDAVTTVDGHNHGLNTAGTGFIITRKLDSQGRDSLVSGAATTRVCFMRNW